MVFRYFKFNILNRNLVTVIRKMFLTHLFCYQSYQVSLKPMVLETPELKLKTALSKNNMKYIVARRSRTHRRHDGKYNRRGSPEPGPRYKQTLFEIAFKRVNIANTAAGRAINVRKSAIATAGSITLGICDGKDNSPSRKNNSICIRPVTPSKKVYKRLFIFYLLISHVNTNYICTQISVSAEQGRHRICKKSDSQHKKPRQNLRMKIYTFSLSKLNQTLKAKPNTVL